MNTQNTQNTLKDIVARNRAGEQVGIYSVCSANRYVLEAAMIEASASESPLLIEATCNQVNQDGGYTGMTPADFRQYVSDIALDVSFDTRQLILGGDHLGPNPWTKLPALAAMEKAIALVKSYVEAGFTKIHLDASMSCADDPTPLAPETIAERAALMCQAAESVCAPGQTLYYVIGTEVPVPGGAQEDLEELQVTTTTDLKFTIETHQALFNQLGISDALRRVVGVVVQPGVEFDHASVIAYEPTKATALKQAIHDFDDIIFEAHSTDYQTPECLRQLVNDHFGILKVGPGLTFAFREAAFALSLVEDDWIEPEERSNLRHVLEQTMVSYPDNWQGYYHGSESEQAFARKYSFSDRSRYYWSHPDVEFALDKLIRNLTNKPAPLPLISQYLPPQYRALRAEEVANNPRKFIQHCVQVTLKDYANACGQIGVA